MIERPQWYSFSYVNTALAAGAQRLYQELTLDTDAPFRMTGVAVYVFNSAGVPLGPAGNVGVTLRFTMPDLSWIQKHLDSAQLVNTYDAQAVNGAGGLTAPYYAYFSPLGKNLFYQTGSRIVIDFAELAGITDAVVMIVFLGTKLYGDGSVWWPIHDPTKPARPYIGYSVQFDPTKLPLYNIPLSINPDADFAWQCGAQTSQPAVGLSPVGAIRNIGIKVKDWTGKYYMNDYIPLDLIFGFDNSQTPGLLYPEIYIPKNQLLYMDLETLG
jgi:hypothetical protein